MKRPRLSSVPCGQGPLARPPQAIDLSAGRRRLLVGWLLLTGLTGLAAPPQALADVHELTLFPRDFSLGVGATSRLPILAVAISADRIRDVTQDADLSVEVMDPRVAEVVPITFIEDDDRWRYRYLRGRAPGATRLRVTMAGGVSSEVAVRVVTSPPVRAGLDSSVMAIGTNLSDLSNNSSELVFSDVFKSSKPWVSSTRHGWDDYHDPELTTAGLDPQGWVRRLLPGQVADTMMLWQLDGHFPTGTYTLTWRGRGRLVVEHGFRGEAIPRIERPRIGDTNVAELRVEPWVRDGLRLRLLEVDPRHPIRDIRLWMPAAESGVHPQSATTLPPHPFRQSFLEQIGQYHRLRFGLWQLALDGTDNQAVTWSQVTPGDHATQFHPYGASPEWIVRLINILNRRPGRRHGVDPWILIPYRAGDDYVRRFAELLAEGLDFSAHPQMRVHVEWANEVWNPSFRHRSFAAEACVRAREILDCSDSEVHRALTYQAHRSLQVFRIFEEVFAETHPVPGGLGRLRRVLAGASGMPGFNDFLLSRPGVAERVDAFAIAPYFGYAAAVAVDRLPPSALPGVDGLLDLIDRPGQADNLARSDLEQRFREIAQAKALVEALRRKTGREIELMAYEGGQHLVGADYETRPHVVPLLAAANRHPRMGDMYRRLLLTWREVEGGGFNHYVHREKWWRQGFFGALTWYDEDEKTPGRPKYRVLLDALAGPDGKAAE